MARSTKLPPIATGQRYNRLIAVVFVEWGADKRARWKFRCECGAEIIRNPNAVRSGNTKSCGCYAKEIFVQKGKQVGAITKHGKYGSREYVSWNQMLNRCRNQNHHAYESYGGRGITVCDRWLEFENFLSDMGPRPEGHSIDRINNNGNYEPNNCRWATQKEQAANRRKPIILGPLANSKSGVRGVHLSSNGKWRALIAENGVKRHLGYFDSLKDAADAVAAARTLVISS